MSRHTALPHSSDLIGVTRARVSTPFVLEEVARDEGHGVWRSTVVSRRSMMTASASATSVMRTPIASSTAGPRSGTKPLMVRCATLPGKRSLGPKPKFCATSHGGGASLSSAGGAVAEEACARSGHGGGGRGSLPVVGLRHAFDAEIVESGQRYDLPPDVSRNASLSTPKLLLVPEHEHETTLALRAKKLLAANRPAPGLLASRNRWLLAILIELRHSCWTCPSATTRPAAGNTIRGKRGGAAMPRGAAPSRVPRAPAARTGRDEPSREQCTLVEDRRMLRAFAPIGASAAKLRGVKMSTREAQR
jgi:hypothetical protein